MNAPKQNFVPEVKLDDYALEDRYVRDKGRVFLTGTQALVRILFMQKAMDERAGLNTAGFVSGYRGSPLGGVDLSLWQAQDLLDKNAIEFLPALNEDLAATAVLGAQQVESNPSRKVEGVFSMWYGKGPGVDRSGDALKHGNAYGSSPHGGVLVVAGDDHACVSSSMSHQSDVAFMAWYMPTINPANIEEYLDYGLWGYALSRFSGMWVGFKAISETVESAASIAVNPLPTFKTPQDFTAPSTGLHYRWPDFPSPEIEGRMEAKIEATLAFARANPIDRTIYGNKDARFGIVTTGKAYLDVLSALEALGLDEARCKQIGIDIYKVGLVWPLETKGMSKFLAGKSDILVIEEKRGVIESQIKEAFYGTSKNLPAHIVGKYDERGEPLVSWHRELSPSLLAPIIARRLKRFDRRLTFSPHLKQIENTGVTESDPGGVARLPYFCSGCPHNSSTKVPEGSIAYAGIGCHFMANWMNRKTEGLTQMGGEGVNWVGKSPFIKEEHVFQNLGEGTYFHSGSLAIRQAVAAKANITYKILFNDAVAMTGGQPVDGVLSVPAIASQVRSEGVERIAILSDEPEKYTDLSIFPPRVTINHRDELDPIQRELRDTKGVTILIFDQTCAAEKRRRRKRGTFPNPKKRAFINDLVCEGCGDCSEQSNCLSVVPKETPFGRKRQIDQNSCNKDFSCVNGFCPSFVTVEGGTLKRADKTIESDGLDKHLSSLPDIRSSSFEGSYDILISGVGGTGVVTIGALITMAAHLEGKGASVLDFMGFAQKGGSVLSFVRLSQKPEELRQVRIDKGAAHTLIACDMVVATSEKALNVLRKNSTRIVANSTEIPTANYVLDRDADMQADRRIDMLKKIAGKDGCSVLAANKLAQDIMGDTIFSNMLMLGYAWQQGDVPVSKEALIKAIELNGVAVEKNKRAFNVGRLAAHSPDLLHDSLKDATENLGDETLDALIARRVAFLRDYQNKSYADRYVRLVEQVRQREAELDGSSEQFTKNVARNAFKLMAYKDEYEVARLHTSMGFFESIKEKFEGNYSVKFHMAPPLLARKKDAAGRPKKIAFGSWLRGPLKLIASLRRFRGTAFDIFGYTAERKMERALRDDYFRMIEEMLSQLTKGKLEIAVKIAAIPDQIRGFGPIKEKSVLKAKVEQEKLLKLFYESMNSDRAA